MSHYKSNLRDIEFNLFEVLGRDEVLGHMAPAATPKPLSARSVVVSLLLGAHPEPMTAREVVAAGEHLGLPSPTVRVALTRAVSAGDLERSGSVYGLGSRLLARRERQAEQAARVSWDRTWEMVVVVATGRPGAERAALRNALAGRRLAELREGVWMRPANLVRPLSVDAPQVQAFTVVPAGDPVELAAALWDLDTWASEARALMARLEIVTEPRERLAVAAHLVRHRAEDPLLPHELWPAGWPEVAAREASAAYEEEIRAISRR